MNDCVQCGAALSGRQRKFCSRQCKNRFGNIRFQSYTAQQRRGRRRKLALLKMHGMQCARCGYGNNHSALEFHHVDAGSKRFNLDLRSLSNRSWLVIAAEAARCVLLCSNCHKEEHNPDCHLRQ